MNVNFLARAVSMYLKDNSPVTPEEYNIQAELKAASHWRFLSENEQIKFVSGPYDDVQVKEAAAFALRRWNKELSEIESGETDAHKMQDDDRDYSEDASSIEERISGKFILDKCSLLYWCNFSIVHHAKGRIRRSRVKQMLW